MTNRGIFRIGGYVGDRLQRPRGVREECLGMKVDER